MPTFAEKIANNKQKRTDAKTEEFRRHRLRHERTKFVSWNVCMLFYERGSP